MRPRWGKANEGAAMSQHPPDGEQDRFEIVFELPPTRRAPISISARTARPCMAMRAAGGRSMTTERWTT